MENSQESEQTERVTPHQVFTNGMEHLLLTLRNTSFNLHASKLSELNSALVFLQTVVEDLKTNRLLVLVPQPDIQSLNTSETTSEDTTDAPDAGGC